jgi:hypothetical protein
VVVGAIVTPAKLMVKAEVEVPVEAEDLMISL